MNIIIITHPVELNSGTGRTIVVSLVGVVGNVVKITPPLVNLQMGPSGSRVPRKPLPISVISKVAPRQTFSGLTDVQIARIICRRGQGNVYILHAILILKM